ncbi:unnamed protein product, partial [Ectocarpus sp. 12 AP-2014]
MCPRFLCLCATIPPSLCNKVGCSQPAKLSRGLTSRGLISPHRHTQLSARAVLEVTGRSPNYPSPHICKPAPQHLHSLFVVMPTTQLKLYVWFSYKAVRTRHHFTPTSHSHQTKWLRPCLNATGEEDKVKAR